MGKLNTVIAFFTGAAVGGAAVWYITKERYAQLAEEEINSVKEAYSHRGEKRESRCGPAAVSGRGRRGAQDSCCDY